MVAIRRNQWLHHAFSALLFFVISQFLGISGYQAVVLFSFLWLFIAIQAFYVEPIHFGVLVYLRLESPKSLNRWFFRDLAITTLWYLSLTWVAMGGGLGSSLALLGLGVGLNALLVSLGPLVGQDRQAPWFFSVLCLPFALPLLLTFVVCFSEFSQGQSALRLLWSIGLTYALIAFFLFPMTLHSVEDV